MKKSKFIVGLPKVIFYLRMSIVCAWRLRSPRVLIRASKFTKIFFKHKLLRLDSGEYKLDFYMPRYPADAFFIAMRDKLICTPPRPVSVVLSITKACSFHCPHCYQKRDLNNELPLNLLLENIRKMRDFGIVAWAIEGGEPLLRFARLEAVLSELVGLEVWVNSTGHLASNEQIKRLAELKVTGVMSSIHSVNPKKHDEFTKVENSWQNSLNFLKKCKAQGMLIGFNTVLLDDEIIAGAIDDIMNLAKDNEIDYVQLIHPKSCGAWTGKVFDTNKHKEAIKIASQAQLKYNSKKSKNMPILTAQVFEESPEMLGCCCGGIDRFYLGSAGDIQPCEFVNLSFGNLNEVSFETAYSRMRKAFAIPQEEWICEACSKLMTPYATEDFPLNWEITQDVIKKIPKGTPTKVYQKMGIYK